MKVVPRKKTVRDIGPSAEPMEGRSCHEDVGSRQQAHRERLVLSRRRALRVGKWIVGLAVLAWAADHAHARDGAGSSGVAGNSRRRGRGHSPRNETGSAGAAGLEARHGPPSRSARRILPSECGSHAWIKEATVERRPPHLLHIAIVERTPAAIIRTGADHWLSDETGYLLASWGRQDDQTLPLLTGLELQLFSTARQASATRFSPGSWWPSSSRTPSTGGLKSISRISRMSWRQPMECDSSSATIPWLTSGNGSGK